MRNIVSNFIHTKTESLGFVLVKRNYTLLKTMASQFYRVQTQFIAALGNPKDSSGVGASNWGIWRVDPGPRGVNLSDWKQLKEMDGLSPAGWVFDQNDWWVEENGLIMEKPDFPIPPGQYVVTGGRKLKQF